MRRGVEWRTTMTSTPIASMFLAVSMKVSPLLRLELDEVKSSVSAREALGGEAEAGPGAGGGLEEEVDDDLPLSTGTILRLR